MITVLVVDARLKSCERLSVCVRVSVYVAISLMHVANFGCVCVCKTRVYFAVSGIAVTC